MTAGGGPAPGGGVAPAAVARARFPRGAALAALTGLAVVVLWFGFIELRGLYFPDEGRYAEIPREMLATGDWVTPRLNGIPYFEKPPLQYWATAALFAVAGADEWSTRLFPALLGFVAVLAVLATARRLYSRRAGWMAGAVMASGLGYFLATQFVTLDMSLTSFLTAALCAFLLAQDAGTPPAGRRRWMLAAWALCALAVLTKGVVGAVLPVLAVGAYVVVRRDASLLRRLHVGAGLAVFLLVAAPWFVLVAARNPGFAEFFFVHEHWQRFTQPVHQRAGPWWYFVPIAVAFLMPWLPAIVGAAARRPAVARPRMPGAFDARTFCWCSAAAIFVFFSASSSKLPAYILPATGAFALAVAPALAARWRASVRVTAWTLVACGFVAVGVAVPAAALIAVPAVRDVYAASDAWVLAGGALLVLGGLAALRLLRGRQRQAALAVVVVAGMAAAQAFAVIAHSVDAYFSGERLLERVTGREGIVPFRPEVPFYSVDMFDQTVPFYLGRTVTLVHEKGELAWGIAAAPDSYIVDVAEFERRWRADDDAYAIMRPETHAQLAAGGLPMRVVDTDGRRVVVARR